MSGYQNIHIIPTSALLLSISILNEPQMLISYESRKGYMCTGIQQAYYQKPSHTNFALRSRLCPHKSKACSYHYH